MKRVLVIEDEPVLRSNVARGIAKLGVETDEAGNLNDALRIIDHRAPQVIVSDIDMPERSGLELLGELGRRGLKVPVVFVSGYLNAYRAQIPPHAAIEVMEKPVSIEDLRAVVSKRLGDEGGSDDAAPFSVPDYLQLACLGQHSVIVEVERGGKRVGEIIAAQGTIWSARDAHGAGLDALGRLAFTAGGSPRVRRLSGQLPARSLDGSWEYLLIEAARVIDEGGGALDVDAAFEQAFEGTPSSSTLQAALPASVTLEKAPELPLVSEEAREFEAAFDAGIEALLAKDHRAAVEAFERARASRPDDAKVLANLARLAQLGFRAAASE